MTSRLARKRTLSTAIALAMSLMTAWPTHSGAMDLSAEKYNVTFQPSGSRRIVFRSETGAFLGYSAEGANLAVQVSGDVIRNSMIGGTPDVKKIVESLPSVRDTAGASYMRMSLPYEVVTAEGRKIPPGTRVLLDMRYFMDDSVRPAGATGDNNVVADRFNDQLFAQAENDTSRPYESVVSDEDDAVPMRTDVDAITDAPVTTAAPGVFPQRFLSAPTCSCAGRCNFSSDFGPRTRPRLRNGGRGSAYHQGIDIGGRGRTSNRVIAAADGVVKIRQMEGHGLGRAVYIDHGNGFETAYGHLASIDPAIRIGERVRRGQTLGIMGQTGASGAIHLHFALYRNGTAVDPMQRLLTRTSASINRACNDQPLYTTVDSAMAPAVDAVALRAFADRSAQAHRAARSTSAQ